MLGGLQIRLINPLVIRNACRGVESYHVCEAAEELHRMFHVEHFHLTAERIRGN
jgi:hypothetical protein